MLHVLNKVYLNLDCDINSFSDRIIISEERGSDDFEPSVGAAFIHSKNVEDLIGNNKSFSTYLEFFDSIEKITAKPLIVYCDKKAFMSLFIAWNKLILKNHSSETLFKYLQTYLLKQSYNSVRSRSLITNNFNQYSLDSWEYSEFLHYYNSIEVNQDLNWNRTILNKISIEYLFSNYLNGNTLVTQHLKDKIALFVKRTIMAELYDVKTGIIFNTFNKKLHDIFGIDKNSFKLNIFDNESLKVFDNPRIWTKGNYFVESNNSDYTSLNIDNLNQEDVIELKKVFKKFLIEHEENVSDNFICEKANWLDWFFKDITDEDLKEFIFSKNFSSSETFGNNDKDTVNFLAIDWFMLLNNSKNPELDTFNLYV